MAIAYRSLAAVVTLLAAPVLRAQTPAAAPGPGPEHQKLAYFLGRWRETVDMKPGPMGPGGKMTATSTCEWFSGGFYLVCRPQGRGPTGPQQGGGIPGDSTERKRDRCDGIH